MNKPIRFGILSFAHHHANHWASAIIKTEEAGLVGIWDDNIQRGKQAAKQYDTRFFDKIGELIKRCDAVGITAETAKHAELIEVAAAAGVHILCEKPIAATLEDCERIETSIKRAGITFMQNFPKRFDPINNELVQLVHRGHLGKISAVRVRHANYHFLNADSQEWFIDPYLCGGGVLLDEGIHAADFLFWLLGEPSSVTAFLSQGSLGLDVEDTAMAVYRYDNGLLAEIVTGGGFLAASESVEVYGTEGTALVYGIDVASMDFTSPPFLKVYRQSEKRGTWKKSDTTPSFLRGEFHQQGPLHFIDCLLNDKQPVTGLVEGRKSLEMILAAYKAARTGCTQKIFPPRIMDNL